MEESLLNRWLEQSSEAGQTLDRAEDNFLQSLSPESGYATSLYQVCMRQLSKLCKVQSEKLSPRTRWKPRVQELQLKLYLFGDSFEHGKLESCLNADEELRGSVVGLLLDIGRILTQGYAISLLAGSRDGSGNFNDETTAALKTHLAEAREFLNIEGSDDDSTDSEQSEDETASYLSRDEGLLERKYFRPLFEYVELLLELCPTLEQTYKHRHQETTSSKLQSEHQISVSIPALSYVQNIRDKFPLASNNLVERLGESNWQRHERLRSIDVAKASEELARSNLPQHPKSLFQPVSIFKDSALGSSLPAISEHAPTVASHSSFLSSTEGQDKGRFRVPKLPKNTSYGEPFLCPFCMKTIRQIRSRVDWK
ncbi:hypothetical protein A1O3_03550 [Capronia epimyces CBS 606.96]|uniref:Uncharacterized protein n=1 Tax=Capronia epimyces CBS 606.96 TaxID=1182542 RepID=W9Y1B0_9EURO|nr:uncharacterized protein A1O3_03550 [Capronia epimyces CBS 606.96]EXJ86597.1 hypothetical protein A1O3_03550 [Capronia epimyces CBS 606.96]